MKLLLTSCLDLYSKNEAGERIAHNFGNNNGILDNIKKLTPKQDNFVFVASVESNHVATDVYANITFESFALTFPFKNYIVLDGRTKDKAKEIIESADFIFLCGGHVPTQNKFFNNINLRELIRNTNALIVGGSAGSMNCADIVYAQPELEGETQDPNYVKYLRGLGITSISILPHFEERINDMLDGKRILTEISMPDGAVRPFIAYSDGAYILDDGKTQIMYGKAFLFESGDYKQITEDGSVTNITNLVNNKFKNTKSINK
ncbi:MAG: Type 1 glutamine amidotransferase-like domain-containing protein [Clostridia bacterium]|nr:Type 1 glutamine amidotransferase-like domain-containing protein [Clostridia bacterium]